MVAALTYAPLPCEESSRRRVVYGMTLAQAPTCSPPMNWWPGAPSAIAAMDAHAWIPRISKIPHFRRG
jgi:hypothetical protein